MSHFSGSQDSGQKCFSNSDIQGCLPLLNPRKTQRITQNLHVCGLLLMSGKRISHGRGGAGNISVDTVEYVDGLRYSPPRLTAARNPRYSTGIGGAGNIRKFNADEIATVQDIPSGPFRVPRATAAGRGGFGNIQEMHKRQALSRRSMSPHGRVSGESQRSTSTTASSATTISNANRKAAWFKALFSFH